MELAFAPYRLRFKHPFGTAHGLRDGTDSVFVRISRGGISGYGEATLPPYLPESLSSVIQEIESINIKLIEAILQTRTTTYLSSPTRSALQVAYIDLITKEIGISASTYYGLEAVSRTFPKSMVTLGLSNSRDIALTLSELPRTEVLKVKLGSPSDVDTIKTIKSLGYSKIFLDANQGWTDLGQAEQIIEVAGADELIGIEQPFRKDRWDLHAQLKQRTDVPIYADESVQGMEDLERSVEAFDGVNVKLMKCGGLDRAVELAKRAREFGLKVMLGNMSESSLGCGAMAALSPSADLVDLDGPWLISNDPFTGMDMKDGRIVVNGNHGTGITLVEPSQLKFSPIGA